VAVARDADDVGAVGDGDRGTGQAGVVEVGADIAVEVGPARGLLPDGAGDPLLSAPP
jgi:hypothetical protein